MIGWMRQGDRRIKDREPQPGQVGMPQKLGMPDINIDTRSHLSERC